MTAQAVQLAQVPAVRTGRNFNKVDQRKDLSANQFRVTEPLPSKVQGLTLADDSSCCTLKSLHHPRLSLQPDSSAQISRDVNNCRLGATEQWFTYAILMPCKRKLRLTNVSTTVISLALLPCLVVTARTCLFSGVVQESHAEGASCIMITHK